MTGSTQWPPLLYHISHWKAIGSAVQNMKYETWYTVVPVPQVVEREPCTRMEKPNALSLSYSYLIPKENGSLGWNNSGFFREHIVLRLAK